MIQLVSWKVCDAARYLLGVTAESEGRELTRWTIHGERVIDETRRLRLSVASVELPDGVTFEQYVLRMPKRRGWWLSTMTTAC